MLLRVVRSPFIRSALVGASIIPGSPLPAEPAYLKTTSTGRPPKSSSPPLEVRVGGEMLGPPTAPMATYAGQPGAVPAASDEDMAPLAQASAAVHKSAAVLGTVFIALFSFF